MKGVRLTFLLFTLCVLCALEGVAQHVVKGVVTDAAGNAPLAGVAVKIKHTNAGMATGTGGDFMLSLPSPTDTLVFSYLGYLVQEIGVGGRSIINVQLQANAQTLSEQVVIGYTTVRRKDLTGSVASLGPDQITRVQSSTLAASLTGVAGVRVTGDDAGSIRIRGNRSVQANNAPLLIVDGMPYYGSLNTIDQYDIASIDVLKDASSAALYGSRGANGIIVITTKKGYHGKPKISFDSYTGVGKYYEGNLHNMNAAEFIQFRRDANQAIGVWSSPADDPKIFSAVELAGFGKIDNNFATEYYDKLGFQTDNTLTFSSGGDKSSQKISLNYLNNTARGDNMRRYDRVMLSTDHDLQVKPNFRVGVSSRLSYERERHEPDNFGTRLFQFIPTVNLFDDNGKPIVFPTGDSELKNPFLDNNPAYWSYITNAYEAFLKGYAEYDIMPGLSFRSNISYDISFTDGGQYQDDRAASYSEPLNYAGISNGKASRMAWNNILNYKRTFGKHSIDAFAVYEVQDNRSFSSAASGSDEALSQYKWYNIGALTQNKSLSSGFVRSQQLSYVGRAQYAFMGKYILTGTIRYDGASQLAAQNRWDYFPSLAAAWNISDEQFFHVKPVSSLKARVSYGITGNNAIAPYATTGAVLSRYTIFAGASGDVPYPTLEPDQLGVSTLKWEKTKMLNAGIDFGFFKDRLTGNIDYYRSNTYDLLNLRKLPYTTGFNQVWDNIGKSRNTGYEIALHAVAIDHKDIGWTVGVSVYHNKEQLVQLYDPRLTKDIQNGWWIGYPVNGVTYDYKALGIWQTSEAGVAAIYGRKPGEVKVQDLNGDGKITGDDRQILGTDRPTLISSLTSTFRYKQFDLMVDVYSELGAITQDSWGTTSWAGDIGRFNAAKVDYWTPTNPSNTHPQPLAGHSSIDYVGSLGYHSNDFIRVRNLTLGYTFKQLKNVDKLRIYAAATNPFQYWRFLQQGGLSSHEIIYNIGFNFTF